MLYLRTSFFYTTIIRMKSSFLKAYFASLVLICLFLCVNAYYRDPPLKYVQMDHYDFYSEESNTRYEMGEQICKDINKRKLPKKYTKVQVIDLLTPLECKLLINDANQIASRSGGYLENRHEYYPTTDLPLDNLDSFPILISKIHLIYNAIHKLYNVDSSLLNISDLFFVRYDHDKQNKLDNHQDLSEFSFIITLNDDFDGGGTKINDNVYKLKIGQCLVFCGQNHHTGVGITKGVRYIIAGFIRVINDDFSNSFK